MRIQPKVIYDTSRYEGLHRSKPRGYGHWVFEVTSSYQHESPLMNYGDAKRWFRNDVAPMYGNGGDTVTVQVLP